jgi:hypothetical protein
MLSLKNISFLYNFYMTYNFDSLITLLPKKIEVFYILHLPFASKIYFNQSHIFDIKLNLDFELFIK